MVQSLLSDIIIWQDSLEVNPSVLIGSFLVGILPYGPFPWKRSMLCIFLVFESRAGKFKLRKENVQILSSSQRNYLKRLIFYRAYNKNEEQIFTKQILLS